MSTPRLPAALTVAAMIRATQAAGGFAAVLKKGDPDSGALLLVLAEKGVTLGVYERLPQPDGALRWDCVRGAPDSPHAPAPPNPDPVADYLARRQRQDPDLWVLELDIAQAERFIASGAGMT